MFEFKIALKYLKETIHDDSQARTKGDLISSIRASEKRIGERDALVFVTTTHLAI